MGFEQSDTWSEPEEDWDGTSQKLRSSTATLIWHFSPTQRRIELAAKMVVSHQRPWKYKQQQTWIYAIKEKCEGLWNEPFYPNASRQINHTWNKHLYFSEFDKSETCKYRGNIILFTSWFHTPIHHSQIICIQITPTPAEPSYHDQLAATLECLLG